MFKVSHHFYTYAICLHCYSRVEIISRHLHINDWQLGKEHKLSSEQVYPSMPIISGTGKHLLII